MREVLEHEIKDQVDRYTARTIPVRTAIDAQQRVLDTSAVETLLRCAEVVALKDCLCRTDYGNCERPLDVCLTLDDTARRDVEDLGRAQFVSLEAALNVLRRSHRAGLVHLAYETSGQPPQIICSCCPCCCGHLVGLLRYGYEHAVVRSDLKATFDPALCTVCGRCVERCPFGAWETDGDSVRFQAGNCFGCGLCASECPPEAIALVPRAT